MNPSATIKLGGADSGTMNVTGSPNQAAIPANTPIKINDLSGTYTPEKSGKVTFTPGTLTTVMTTLLSSVFAPPVPLFPWSSACSASVSVPL